MTRPSPTESATLYKVGTVKTGNDGNKWIISESSNGVKRWKLYRKVGSKKVGSKKGKVGSKKVDTKKVGSKKGKVGSKKGKMGTKKVGGKK
jgi:hypothetical protein